MKDIEEKFQDFLEKQNNLDENLNLFNSYLKDNKISENKYEIKSFLYLIVAISNHYHRSQYFFSKIEFILKIFQKSIQFFFTNSEIFNIFSTNKRLLLILFNFKILKPDNVIYSILKNNKKYVNKQYLEYFYIEFEPFIKADSNQENTIQEHSIDEFKQKREKGENDHFICELIRNDLVIDFITYTNKTNISLSSTIQQSIYETNLFLLNKNPSLIEYSAFFGSIQIFRYLFQQKVELTTSIWPYAIHGKNGEIIHFIEYQKISTLNNSYQYLIIEAIKCHHNELIDYFRNNFCENEKIYDFFLYRKSLKYYNFAFLTDDIISLLMPGFEYNIPYYLCKYDYYLIVEFLLKNTKTLNINKLYTIYKPIDHKNTNIVLSIAIKNGELDALYSEEEKEYEKEDKSYYEILKEKRKYTTYFYDEEKSTILNVSIQKGNIDIIQLLVSQSKIDLKIKSTKIYKEIQTSMDDFYEYILITEEKALLHEAIENGNIEVVQLLLKNKLVNVNDNVLIKKIYIDYCSTANTHYEENYEKTMFHLAIEKGTYEIVKLLLSNSKIDIKKKSISKIKEEGGCICYTSSFKIIKRSSLFFAINNRNMTLNQLLLSNRHISINSGMKMLNEKKKILEEKTPLFLAVENENTELVKLLLKQRKININYICTFYIYRNHQRTLEKWTALDLAKEKNNIEIIHLLSKK